MSPITFDPVVKRSELRNSIKTINSYTYPATSFMGRTSPIPNMSPSIWHLQARHGVHYKNYCWNLIHSHEYISMMHHQRPRLVYTLPNGNYYIQSQPWLIHSSTTRLICLLTKPSSKVLEGLPFCLRVCSMAGSVCNVCVIMHCLLLFILHFRLWWMEALVWSALVMRASGRSSPCQLWLWWRMVLRRHEPFLRVDSDS